MNAHAQQDEALHKLRHSAAHLLAHAVTELYPGVQVGIGPAVENGFYYDFLRDQPFTPEDLQDIGKRMRELAEADIPIERVMTPKAEAVKLYRDLGQALKVELVEEKGGEEVSNYRQGSFIDFCLGPHVSSTGQIKHFKVLSSSGAYWKGDESSHRLQRIYGTAWHNRIELDAYLKRLEEAKARDHRRLGKDLGLFHISPTVGAGLPLWLPKGTILRETLESFLREAQVERGYLPVITPHIAKIDLYKTSGHYPYYSDSQYTPIDVDGELFLLKPMNCPHHIEIYKSEPKSYRDLPYRLAEFGTVYRYEKSGELTGLTRVRGFTVDDSHLFVTPEQLEDEFIHVVELIQYVFNAIGLEDFRARLGTNDPDSDKYAGSLESWEEGTRAIQNAADKLGLQYTVELGEAAFYGPKLDFIFRDVLKREWQLGTVQVDFWLPERFDLEYTAEDGLKHRPVMIHRAPFGSMERFVGILIEHFNGAFPLWLSPVQAVIIPITDDHLQYAKQVAAQLKSDGLRVEVDDSSRRMNAKIREAQLQKTPYMLIIGDREMATDAVAVRTRNNEDRGAVPLAEFSQAATTLVTTKSMEL